MPNYKGRAVRRKHDEWHYFDLLPRQLRQRIAGATLPWSANAVLVRYRKLRKAYGEDRAVRIMIDQCDSWDRLQAFRQPWIKPRPGQKAEPTPCRQADVQPLIARAN